MSRSAIKEAVSLRRLLHTPKAEKAIMVYASQADCYPTFEGLIKELTKRNLLLCYITSDANDPILHQSNSHLKAFYIDRLFPLLAALVNCKVLITTLTDLNQLHIRRSINPVHYVYIFHSLVSTHMIYSPGAFDHYDSILCCGPHQISEIRKREELKGLPSKKLMEVGYPRLERIYNAYQKYSPNKSQVKTVLVAPSWGVGNIIESCGRSLVELLLDASYKVVVRPHPETTKHSSKLVRQYLAWFESNPNFTLETSVATDDSLLLADVLISDYSGIALEYAFGTERPIIFIDTSPKVHNLKYKELDLEPLELALRSKIGVIISPRSLKEVPEAIYKLIEEKEAWKTPLIKLRNEYVFNFGRASKIGANYIVEVSNL